MKVLFLQDNGINESLAMMDVSGLLKSNGHQTHLLIQKNEKHFVEKIKDYDAPLIIVPMDVWGEKKALSIAAEARKVSDGKIVFCGTYPVLFPEIIEHPEVDFVIQGEAEYPILELAENIERGEDISSIENLVLKRDDEIIQNQMRPLLTDLTALPLPDRDLYHRYGFIRRMSMKRFTSGRGCPNACSFCFNAKFREIFRGRGKYVRRKPVSRIIEEIMDVKSSSVLKSVHFSDDLFTQNRAWVLEFCEKYKKSFTNLPFTCNTTVHDVDDEMLAAMKNAGCFGIAIGVETGNEELRMKRLNKPYKDSDIRRTAAMIKKHGLFLTAFNMIALPYETIDNAFETVRLNREIKADNVRVTFLSPIPRTNLVESAIKDGLLDNDYEETGSRIMTPEIKTRSNDQFETLYALFDLAVASPALEKLSRRLINIKIPSLIKFFLFLPRVYREKKFFSITFLSGFLFYLNTSLPQYRTKNFNNFLP